MTFMGNYDIYGRCDIYGAYNRDPRWSFGSRSLCSFDATNDSIQTGEGSKVRVVTLTIRQELYGGDVSTNALM